MNSTLSTMSIADLINELWRLGITVNVLQLRTSSITMTSEQVEKLLLERCLLTKKIEIMTGQYQKNSMDLQIHLNELWNMWRKREGETTERINDIRNKLEQSSNQNKELKEVINKIMLRIVNGLQVQMQENTEELTNWLGGIYDWAADQLARITRDEPSPENGGPRPTEGWEKEERSYYGFIRSPGNPENDDQVLQAKLGIPPRHSGPDHTLQELPPDSSSGSTNVVSNTQNDTEISLPEVKTETEGGVSKTNEKESFAKSNDTVVSESHHGNDPMNEDELQEDAIPQPETSASSNLLHHPGVSFLELSNISSDKSSLPGTQSDISSLPEPQRSSLSDESEPQQEDMITQPETTAPSHSLRQRVPGPSYLEPPDFDMDSDIEEPEGPKRHDAKRSRLSRKKSAVHHRSKRIKTKLFLCTHCSMVFRSNKLRDEHLKEIHAGTNGQLGRDPLDASRRHENSSPPP